MSAMQNILVPIDGSDNAERAVDFALELANAGLTKTIHLVNVQIPVPSAVTTFLGKKAVSGYHHDEGMKSLATTKAKLDAANIEHHVHIGVGDAAEIINAFAKELHCDGIVMGTRGRGGAAGLLLGSVARDVIAHSSAPVTLVK